jgi:hypothetical protein
MITVLAVLLVMAALASRPRLPPAPPTPVAQTTAPPLEAEHLPPGTVVRVDAGADSARLDRDGRMWQRDGAYAGDPSSVETTDDDIVGTSRDSVFATLRVDPIAYSFPVPNGCFRILTHHAEIDPDVQAGDRETAVWVEGDVASVHAADKVGNLTAYSQEFRRVNVSDGSVDLRFAAVGREPPTVAGIEVHRETGCTSPPMGRDVDVKKLVEDAVAAGQQFVRIPPGEHQVTDTIEVNDGGGIVIDATGATLVFSCTQNQPSGCSAFRFTGQGAVLRGATIDFDPLPFTQGVITGRSGTSVTIALDSGYPDVDWFVRTAKQHQLHFDDQGRWKQPVMVYASVARGSDSRTAVLLVQPRQVLELAVGDRMVLTGRGGANAIEMLFGDGELRLEQVTILSATGLAIYAQHWAGTATLAFPTVRRGPRPSGAETDRLISTNQDALRWVVSRSGPTVYGADIGWQGDDGVNFQGYPLTVEAVESATTLLLRPVVRWVSPDEVFRAGDRLRIMNRRGAEVQAVETIRRIEEVTAADGQPVFRLTLARPVEASAGQIADIPEHNAPDAVVRSSRFHDHVANGMRVKGDGWVVEGNAFDHLVGGHGVLVQPDYNAPNWRESGWVDGLIVERNVFRDIGGEEGGDAVRVAEWDSDFNGHRGITISHNTIGSVRGHGISVRNVDGAVISGNRISATSLQPIDVEPSSQNVAVTQ